MVHDCGMDGFNFFAWYTVRAVNTKVLTRALARRPHVRMKSSRNLSVIRMFISVLSLLSTGVNPVSTSSLQGWTACWSMRRTADACAKGWWSRAALYPDRPTTRDRTFIRRTWHIKSENHGKLVFIVLNGSSNASHSVNIDDETQGNVASKKID